ncbi:MAG: phage capsid protein, partial [Lachnospiraceae bacterium]|nr:phage capsid protein [Lachnospiraceae bacterium]
MAEETVNQVTQSAEGEQKTFTQEEVNSIVAERLGRDRQKYADYDSLKQKAEEFDRLQEANKTELQKATERAEILEKELAGIKKT